MIQRELPRQLKNGIRFRLWIKVILASIAGQSEDHIYIKYMVLTVYKSYFGFYCWPK